MRNTLRLLRRVACGFVILSAIGATQPSTGLTYVYQTTDARLWEQMDNAARWKDFFTVCGDATAAAYYAGRESVYAEQLTELGVR